MNAMETALLERCVLGCVLLSGEIPPDASILSLGDYTIDSHKLVWSAMLGLHDKAEPIDILTVSERLSGVKPVPKDGWSSWLSQLSDEIPSIENLGHWVGLLQARCRRADFIAVMTEQLERSKDPSIDGDELMSAAVAQLSNLADARAVVRPIPMRDAMRDEFKAVERRHAGEVFGHSTGYKSIDSIAGSMAPGTLIVAAGRPGMGKSALAQNIVHRTCIRGELKSVIVSLEMSSQEQAQRMMAISGRIDLSRMRTGQCGGSDWARLSTACNELNTDRVHIIDRPGLSITQVRTLVRAHASRHGLDLVVVDYIQLMDGSEGRNANREQQVSSVVRGLKTLAGELKLPVIALSQLNRGVEARNDKRPMLSDLRETGTIEQDADQVWLIYRHDYYRKSDDAPDGVAEIGIAKNRNGPTGMIRLKWWPETTTFTELRS